MKARHLLVGNVQVDVAEAFEIAIKEIQIADLQSNIFACRHGLNGHQKAPGKLTFVFIAENHTHADVDRQH